VKDLEFVYIGQWEVKRKLIEWMAWMMEWVKPMVGGKGKHLEQQREQNLALRRLLLKKRIQDIKQQRKSSLYLNQASYWYFDSWRPSPSMVT
jgi:hypothetical protein